MKYTNTIIILVLLHITVLYCSQYNDRNKDNTMAYQPQVINSTDAEAFEPEPEVNPLTTAINEINQLFSSQEGGAKLSDQSTFMHRMAATESNYGKDKMGDYSFSPFQLDDIRYKDIQERGQGGNAAERVAVANDFLREKLGREDFDLLNLNLVDEEHNPYIGAALARLGLASVPGAVPEDMEGQAQYWKDNWNTAAGKGTPEHFTSQSKAHGFGEDYKNIQY